MWAADKRLIINELGPCKQHPIQFQHPRGSGHVSKNVDGLFSTRYIQCHNLVLIKDIHVHHMISSTVLNTDVSQYSWPSGNTQAHPSQVGAEIKVAHNMLATK